MNKLAFLFLMQEGDTQTSGGTPSLPSGTEIYSAPYPAYGYPLSDIPTNQTQFVFHNLTSLSTHFHQDPLHIPAYLIKIFNHFFFRYQMYK